MWNKKLSYVFLAIGFICFTFCGGRYSLPATAWIWPAALLLFFHNSDGKKRYILTALALGAGYSIKSIGVLGSSIAFDMLLGFIVGLIYIIPFLVDGLIAEKHTGIANSLVFPLAWTSMEYLLGYSTVGAWNAIGYSQCSTLAIMQLASILGIYGVSFIVLWTSSAFAYIHENWDDSRRTIPVLIVCPLILILVLSYGTIRLHNADEPLDYVLAASLCGPVLEKNGTEYIPLPYEDNLAHLKKTVKHAAEKDIQFLLYNEEAFELEDKYEESFTEEACRLAKKHGMYLLLGLELSDTDNSENGLSINMIKFINKEGEVEWDYLKTRLVPVVESSSYVRGDGKIKYSDTDFGRVTSLICFDCDSPQFVNRINDINPDFLVLPSWEWEGIYENHTKSLKVRAIENGIPMLKASYEGIHFAVDCYGRTIQESNNFTDGFGYLMIAEVPLNTADTIYSKAGRYIDFIFIVLLAALAVIAVARRKK